MSTPHRVTPRGRASAIENPMCGHGRCTADVMPDIDVQLCERHLAKAWAAFELITGNPEPAAQENPIPDTHSTNIPGAIYFIRVGDLLKIGWTSDVAGRFRQLSPDAVIHIEAGTKADERDYHRQFAEHLVHGREWFTCNDTTMNAVNIIARVTDKAA